MLSHHNIVNNGHFIAEILRYTEADRVCVPVPFYHCFGMVIGNLACMARGACVVVPGEGFDPLAVLDIQRVIGQLKERRIGVLVTDHNVREALNITDHAYIINDGRILRDGSPEELSNDVEVKKVYLGENFRLN